MVIGLESAPENSKQRDPSIHRSIWGHLVEPTMGDYFIWPLQHIAAQSRGLKNWALARMESHQSHPLNLVPYMDFSPPLSLQDAGTTGK